MKQNVCDICKNIIQPDEKFIHGSNSITMKIPFIRKGIFYGNKGQRSMEAIIGVIAIDDKDNDFINTDDEQPHVCFNCFIDAVKKLDKRPAEKQPRLSATDAMKMYNELHKVDNSVEHSTFINIINMVQDKLEL